MKTIYLLRKISWPVLVVAVQLCLMPALAQRSRTITPVTSAAGGQPELIVQLGFSNGVTCLAFSPDGRLILAGSKDKTARLWETATGRLIRRFGMHEYELEAVAFSNDGRYVLTVTEEDFRVWNGATGQQLHRFKRQGGEANLPSDDKRFRMELVSADQKVPAVLRDAVTNKELARFGGTGSKEKLGTTSEGSRLKSPDGRFVLEDGDRKTVILKDAATGKEVRRLVGHSEQINAFTFSPDGRWIATGSGDESYQDNSVRLWDVETGQEVRRFEGEATLLTAVSFSPDGRFIETEGSEFDALVGQLMSGGVVLSSAYLWDITTGQQVRHLNAGVTSLVSAASSPDGRFILTGGWETARLWNAETGQEVERFFRHSSWVRAVAVSSDDRLVLTGSSDNTARLWDAVTGKETRRFIGHTEVVTSVALSPDKRFVLTASDDHSVRLWSAATGKELRCLDARDPIAFSPDGRFYITDSSSAPTLWETTTGNEVRRFGKDKSSSMDSVAFSPDGHFVLTANRDYTIRLWDVNSGQEVRQFVGHTSAIHSVAFSRDGRLALSGSGDLSAHKDSTLRLWDVATGKEARQYGKFANPVFYVAFAPDGRSVWAEEFDDYGETRQVSWGEAASIVSTPRPARG